MKTSYAERWKKESPLAKLAGRLRETTHHKSCRLSPLVLMTDPARVADPIKSASILPDGAAIIFRHFGAKDARATAQKLRQITHSKNQQLLIGNDPKLAEQVEADGVHFSRSPDLSAPLKWHARKPGWIISMAGLKSGYYLERIDILDAIFISSVFPSTSASAGAPIGPKALAIRAARLPVPIFALGGINEQTAPALIGTRAAGLAAIGGLSSPEL